MPPREEALGEFLDAVPAGEPRTYRTLQVGPGARKGWGGEEAWGRERRPEHNEGWPRIRNA